tara:strand:+ start:46648 stop:47994 length:1347 start_codon:yes stop_codon:yes gene_type:complete
MKEVLNKQIELISYTKSYLNKCKKGNIDTANSSFCYFAHWSYFPGAAKLKLKIKGPNYFFNYAKTILFNLLGVSTLSNYITIKHKVKINKFKNLIITNVSKKDFKKDGSCFDPHFQTNSRKTPRTLWFLNCIDNYIPKKFDKNIIIFARKKTFFRHDIIFFIKIFFKVLFKFKLSLKRFFHEFSVHSQFSNIISKKILLEISKGKFKRVINSYEAQPFQNTVFKKIKKINSDIQTIGFFHTALSPMSTSLIYRSGSPDKLLISGNYSKEFLSKNLMWPKEKIKIIPSFRYNKKNVPDMSGFIFLPYNFFNLKKIIEEFENFLKISEPKSLNFFKIKNHTHANESKKHLMLIEELKKIMKIYQNRFDTKKKKKKSIIIGGTSTVIVALQSNVEIIHICEDPIFEMYSENLWRPLKVNKVSKNTYVYRQKTKDSLVKFSNSDNLLRKYCY